MSLFKPEINMVFYDLTSTYFESEKRDELREFGYSKDKKNECVQIIIGIITDKEGLPLGYEVFSGSTSEVNTVIEMLEKLREKAYM